MSLRLRLALWYGGLTGLVVFLVSMLSYAAHSRAQYDDLDRQLESAAHHVAGVHATAGTSDELAAMLAVPLAPNLAVRVYGPAGAVLVASPNAAAVPEADPAAVLARPSQPAFDALAGLAPPFAAVDAGRGAFGLAAGPDGSRWRLYVLPGNGAVQHLLAAAPLGSIDASVLAFRRLIPLLTLVGIVVSFVGGGLVAGRALRPVALLTATARAIARSRSFRQRVPVEGGRDELSQLAATFNEMLASLEQAYQSQQRFVADASHELRAPLTAIQGNLELLERQPTMPTEEQREAISEAIREARRLARLVADLLALARADAGVALRRERVELDRVLMDALSEARHLARGHRLEVTTIEPVVIAGDQDYLKQLLLILLDNALRYTPPPGTVALSLRRNGTQAELAVRDTGVGIAAADLALVFERFYRADPAHTRNPGGTGLGLPIARWIVQQHGGDLVLTSAPQQGTTATVRLPLRTQPDR
ncbi:MAG: HAMP domain-containing histidine kinase [Chloroflexi bacterium]|nr:HAMP domain-containing histidine kinase [Chloroflexota bacterium]